MACAHRYWSGEEVKAGDRITYAGQPGTVEFVALDGTFEPTSAGEAGWPQDGFMIRTEAFGLIFLDSGEDEEDLNFVSRASKPIPQDEQG